MRIAHFFIDHPRFAAVINIFIVIFGLAAVAFLPVAQYPNIVPPTIQVQANYPGASAETVARTVATPLEQAINGVEGMDYISSQSTGNGQLTVTVIFKIGTDPNVDLTLTQNRVDDTLSRLPQEVQAQGVQVKKTIQALLLGVHEYSPDGSRSPEYMSNYFLKVRDQIARIPGVADFQLFGNREYAMRIWIDPDKAAADGISASEILAALRAQNVQVSAGVLNAPPVETKAAYQINVEALGRLKTPEEFGAIIVKSDSQGRVTRIRDIGRVELGAQTYSQSFMQNGRPAAGIGIFQLPEANAITVAKDVAAKMAELSKSFPPGLAYDVPFDTTKFVTASIDEVYVTLIEAGVLVLIVILVFLQDWRAMLVPATTVPVTIIGAFAAMAALGFTVNLSTLFAIVLAIGIVVDDAIVIVEGVARHIEQGMSGRKAAEKAMDELFGPVIGITLVLMAVFIPAAFLPGLTGQLYKQFALVIAATALISAINAMTLKPTQCALWLRPPVPPEKRNVFYRGFNKVYDKAEHGYTRLIGGMVHRSGLAVLAALVLMGVAIWGLTRLPTAFLPLEDQGYVLISAQLPDGASKERTDEVMAEVGKIAQQTPGVDQVLTISGISILDNSASLPNAGVAYVVLKDWDVRGKEKGQDLFSIYEHLNGALSDILKAKTLVVVPPPIQGIGNANGFTMQVEIRNGNFDFPLLQATADAIVKNGNAQSSLQRLSTSFRAGVPQLSVSVDRIKAETLGITTGQVFSALSGYVGSSYITQFNKFGRTFQVYAQAAPEFRIRPEDIRNLSVRAGDGTMVPLGTIVDVKSVQGPSLISLYNLYPTATIVGGSAAGFSSGQALDVMEQIADRTLPPGSGFEWTALSYQEKAVGTQIYFVFGLAMLLVYFVLAGQYESWILPLAVLLAVPLALLGTVGALSAAGVANNLYTQIGLILLIALASKNAILIVEYAREKRAEGMEILEAAVEAARLRFRPILMTSFAFILGVVPLVLASGAGASARKSIGISVFSGMIASTCLAVLFVPSFYVVLQRFEEYRKRRANPAPQAAE